MKRLCVFASGSGSDFQSVIDGVKSGLIDGKIELLVASKPDIYAVARAEAAGIPYVVFRKSDYPSAESMYEALIPQLKDRGIDLIVLAGYLTVLTPNIVSAFRGRIINIHPSLIPAYCGDGYYGMRVHRAVIENGEKFSGATVHYVDEGTDTGEIIAQERVPVYESDTPETLQARVLELEHRLLPETVARLCRELK
ncbi:MAG: phosphoribosylglycinamide formyltransferase [Christensenellales bacterium]|jgi:phosphoribosylglycinamide formyltransferase